MKDKYARITRKASLSFLTLLIGINFCIAQVNPFYTNLDINNINARFNVSGSDFWDFGTANPSFEAPKGSGKHSMFA